MHHTGQNRAPEGGETAPAAKKSGRVKQARLVVTFRTTAAALRMEDCAKRAQLAGRLIPTPREISAGCGLAWSAPADQEHDLRLFLQQYKMEVEQVSRLML